MNSPSKTINISLTGVELTESELRSAYILSNYQKLGLQKLIAEIANQKVALKFTPNDPVAYAQQEAELAGQLLILTHLLDLSQSYEIEATEALRNSEVAQSNQQFNS